MGKSSKKDKQKEERLGLWQINEIHISENYAQGVADDGRVYYSKVTSRPDLPDSFWDEDWQYELDAREFSERQAVSSGTSALETRGKTQGRLISQEIANNPNIGAVTSSATAAQDKRGKGKGKGAEREKKK